MQLQNGQFMQHCSSIKLNALRRLKEKKSNEPNASLPTPNSYYLLLGLLSFNPSSDARIARMLLDVAPRCRSKELSIESSHFSHSRAAMSSFIRSLSTQQSWNLKVKVFHAINSIKRSQIELHKPCLLSAEGVWRNMLFLGQVEEPLTISICYGDQLSIRHVNFPANGILLRLGTWRRHSLVC